MSSLCISIVISRYRRTDICSSLIKSSAEKKKNSCFLGVLNMALKLQKSMKIATVFLNRCLASYKDRIIILSWRSFYSTLFSINPVSCAFKQDIKLTLLNSLSFPMAEIEWGHIKQIENHCRLLIFVIFVAFAF